jgi:hypothetical protein
MSTTKEPESFVCGNTVNWTKHISEYLPADGWVLKYHFRRPGTADKFSVTSTTDGDSHSVTIAAAATALLTAGNWYYQSYVEKLTEKIHIASGVIAIIVDYSATGTVDPRTWEEITLDAIRAVIQGRATANQSSVKVGDKELRYYSFDELLRLEESISARVDRLRRAAAGEPPQTAVYATFI